MIITKKEVQVDISPYMYLLGFKRRNLCNGRLIYYYLHRGAAIIGYDIKKKELYTMISSYRVNTAEEAADAFIACMFDCLYRQNNLKYIANENED